MKTEEAVKPEGWNARFDEEKSVVGKCDRTEKGLSSETRGLFVQIPCGTPLPLEIKVSPSVERGSLSRKVL